MRNYKIITGSWVLKKKEKEVSTIFSTFYLIFVLFCLLVVDICI